MDLAAVAPLLAAIGAFGTMALGVYKYVTLKERKSSVRAAFEQAIDMLSADDRAHRQAGAILMRRFFASDAEQGGKGTPYAQEALGVMTALLRGAESDQVQKLLADGLAYAPDLKGADLQKTNLQNAYLGMCKGKSVELSYADFYQADLTGASFKGAVARKAVFYQARLIKTVFDQADLTGANFFDSDLMGARFEGSRLSGADFSFARNVPNAITQSLGPDGVYGGSSSVRTPNHAPAVFLGRSGCLNDNNRGYIRALSGHIGEHGFEIVEVRREDYSFSGAVAEVRRAMSGCAGVVVGLVADFEADDGCWRAGTPDYRRIGKLSLPSPWMYLEAGMAFGLGLPVLLAVANGVDSDAFDYSVPEAGLRCVIIEEDHRSPAFRASFDEWCGMVREASRLRTSS
jgi:hypothetical protein